MAIMGLLMIQPESVFSQWAVDQADVTCPYMASRKKLAYNMKSRKSTFQSSRERIVGWDGVTFPDDFSYLPFLQGMI